MHDRQFEERLAARLKRRFGSVEPSPGLRARIAADRASVPVSIRPSIRWAQPSGFGIAAVVAVLLVATIVIGPRIGAFGGPPGSATQTPPASPTATPFPSGRESTYTLRSLVEGHPPKDVTSTATDVLSARLRAIGIGNFSVSGGDDIVFSVPGPVDPRIVQLLTWPGGVSFVGIPNEVLDSRGSELAVHDRIPEGLTPIFTESGVEGTVVGSENPPTTLEIDLDAAATAAFADYSASHVGEESAIVRGDGTIEYLVRLNEPITGGKISLVVPADASETPVAILAAVLSADALPAIWSSGDLSATSAGPATVAFYLTGSTVGEQMYLLSGRYTVTEDAGVPEDGVQCRISVDAVPLSGGVPVPLSRLSIAPGSSTQGSHEVDIPPADYRIVVDSGCTTWTLGVEQ